jgi:predicted nucleic acid-binding protein
MNKTTLTLILGVFVIGMFSLALGVAQDAAQKEARQTIKAEGNNTFGNCVSDGAVLKNTCYETVKTAKETCKMDAKAQNASRTVIKGCDQTYKKDKKQCKTVFKSSKNECKKIKHNFFEGAKASFK